MAKQENLDEKIIASKTAWTGSFLKADELEVILPNNKHAHRDVIRHPGAVGIVALTDTSDIILVKQYRTPLERVTLEIPAGKLEPGEDASVCAARELEEECGITAHKLSFLTSIATSAGFSDEILHLYMATELEFFKPHPDEDEFIAITKMPLADFVDLVLDGKIEDAKTIIGALICDAIAHRLA